MEHIFYGIISVNIYYYFSIFRLFNSVDIEAQETRKAFEQELIRGWSSIDSNIDKYLEKVNYTDVKTKLDKDCAQIANRYSCYVIFLLHKIGTSNLTYGSSVKSSIVNKLSRNPFVYKVVDTIYSGQVIPELQANILQLNLSCSDCFLEDRQVVPQFYGIYKTLELCPTPISKACTNSLVSAYGMTSKIKILFSTPTFFLGTAFSGLYFKNLH